MNKFSVLTYSSLSLTFPRSFINYDIIHKGQVENVERMESMENSFHELQAFHVFDLNIQAGRKRIP